MERDGAGVRVVGAVGAGLLGAVGRSLLFQIEGQEHVQGCRSRGQPVIFAHWHRWILPLAYLHRRQGIVVLVSDHRDGEYITSVIEQMGFATARGSSTRGGTKGLKALVRAGREGRDMGITPDGPRGPALACKPGALVAAQLSGAPIVPIAVESAGVWQLESWDRFVFPKPFAAVRVRYGAPHYVPRDANEADFLGHARAIEDALNVLSAPAVHKHRSSV